MKRLGIKLLLMFLCGVCAGVSAGESPSGDKKKETPSSDTTHANGSPDQNEQTLPAALAGPIMDERARKTLETAKQTLDSLSELSSNETARKLFREAAPALIKEMEELAEYYEKNGQTEQAKKLRSSAEDLKSELEDKTKPTSAEMPPILVLPNGHVGGDTLSPRGNPASGGSAINASGKNVPVTVIRPDRLKPITPALGSKPESVTINGKRTQVHFLGNSRGEFNSGLNLYLVPLGPKGQEGVTGFLGSDSSAGGPAYVAVPASEVLSLEAIGTENSLGVNRFEAFADFVQTLPEASKDLVEGLRDFSPFKPEKDKQALQTNLRDYLRKTEGSSTVTPAQREVLARAVLELERQTVQRMSLNSGARADELLGQYDKPKPQFPEPFSSPLLIRSSEEQLRQIEKHAADALARAGESGAEVVKQLSQALGYDVPLAAIPKLLNELSWEDREKVKALAGHGLHTRQNPDGTRQIKREDLQRALEDLVISPSETTKRPDGTEAIRTATEKVSDMFATLLPGVNDELKKGNDPYRQLLLAAINGDQTTIARMLKEQKASPEDVRRVLEGGLRDLVSREFASGKARLDGNGQLDPEAKKRILENPTVQILRTHLGLSEEQFLDAVADQTANILNLPGLQLADQLRVQQVANLEQEMGNKLSTARTEQEREAIRRDYEGKFRDLGEPGLEARKRLSLAQEAASAAREALASREAEAAKSGAELTQARQAVDQRLELIGRELTTMQQILENHSNWRNLSPLEQRSFFDRNGWSEFLHKRFGDKDVPLSPGTQLSDNLEGLIRSEIPRLQSEQQRLRAVVAAPGSDPRLSMLGGETRTDFPVTRKERIWDGNDQNPGFIDVDVVKKDGTYDEWLAQQREKDSDGMGYLLAYREQQRFQKGLEEARAQVAGTTAVVERAVTDLNSESSNNRGAFFERAGFGESAGRFLADLQGVTGEVASLANSRNSPGTSASPTQREAINGLLRNREEQVVAGLRSAGMAESEARLVLTAYNEDAATQTKNSDSAFLRKERELAREGYKVGAFGLEFYDNARAATGGKSGGVTFNELLENTFILGALTGSNSYSINLNNQIARAADTQAPIQLGRDVALHINDRRAFQAGLATGEFKGVSLVSTQPFRERAAQHLAQLEEVERQLDELSRRPGDAYSPEMQAKQKQLRERQIELARLIQKAGSIDIPVGENLFGRPQQAPAQAIAAGILGSLGQGGAARRLATIAASMDQEQAEVRMYVTGTAAVALSFLSAGTASPLLGLVGAASAGYAGTLGEQVVSHQYQRFLHSQGILAEKPYFDKVQAENASLVAAGRSALTFGFGKMGGTVGLSPLGSRLAGAAGSSALTSSSLDQFFKAFITQSILSGASVDALSKFGKAHGGVILAQALGLDFGAGVAVDLARVAANDGVFTFSDGTQLDAGKSWKNFAAVLGAAAISNAPASAMAAAREGRERFQLQAARAANAIRSNPEVYVQVARANPELAAAALRALPSETIARFQRDPSALPVSNPQFLAALTREAGRRQSAETSAAVGAAEAAIERSAPKREDSGTQGVLGRLREAWGRTTDQIGAFFGRTPATIDWAKIPESSREILIQLAIRNGFTDEGLRKLGVTRNQIQIARERAPLLEAQRILATEVQDSGRVSQETVRKVGELYSRATKTVQDQIRALIDPLLQKSDFPVSQVARERERFGIKTTALVGPDGNPLRDPASDGQRIVPTPPRKASASQPSTAPTTTRSPPAPASTSPASPAFRAVSNIPGANRNNFDVPTLARLAEVPGSEISGLARQALSQQPPVQLEQALKQTDLTPSEKSKVEEALSLQSQRPSTPKKQKAELKQTNQQLSSAIRTVAQQEIQRGVEAGTPRAELDRVAQTFGQQSFLRATLAQAPTVSAPEGARADRQPETTQARDTTIKPNFQTPTTETPPPTPTIKPASSEVASSAAPRAPPETAPAPTTKKSLLSTLTDWLAPKPIPDAGNPATPKDISSVIEDIARGRGIRPEDITPSERATIQRVEEGIQKIQEARGLTYEQARDAHFQISEMVSVNNRGNQLKLADGSKSESLDAVVSRALLELGPEFFGLSHVDRMRQADKVLRGLYQIDPSTPYRAINPNGVVSDEGSLLTKLVEAVANIHPVSLGSEPLYRAQAVKTDGADVNSPFARQALVTANWERQSQGRGYVHAGSDKKAVEGFVTGVRMEEGRVGVVYEFPPGAKGFAVNGEGPIKAKGNVAHKNNDVVPNDIGILHPGKNFEPDLSTIRYENGMIYVKLKPIEGGVAPTTRVASSPRAPVSGADTPSRLLDSLRGMLPRFGESRSEKTTELPKAGPKADARFLVQKSYEYDTTDTSFTKPMGEAIDVAVTRLQDLFNSGKPISAKDVFQIMDEIAAVRKQIAVSKEDPGQDLFGTPLMRVGDESDPKREVIEMQDYVGKTGRHSGYLERATDVSQETIAQIKAKKQTGKIQLFGQAFPKSYVIRLGDTATVIHPRAGTAAPLLQKAVEEWGKALSNPKLSESQFMDKMAEVYTALMHATPYQRGSPAIVESMMDASLRAKFGKTLGMKTAEPFWEVILASPKKPVLTGADLKRFFGGKLQVEMWNGKNFVPEPDPAPKTTPVALLLRELEAPAAKISSPRGPPGSTPPPRVSQFETEKARAELAKKGVELTPNLEKALTEVHEMFPHRGPGELTRAEKREKLLAGKKALREVAKVSEKVASDLTKMLMREGILGNKKGRPAKPIVSPSAKSRFEELLRLGFSPDAALNTLGAEGFKPSEIESVEGDFTKPSASQDLARISGDKNSGKITPQKARELAKERLEQAIREENVPVSAKGESNPLQQRAQEFGLFAFVTQRLEERGRLEEALREAFGPNAKVSSPEAQKLLSENSGKTADEIIASLRKQKINERAVVGLGRALSEFVGADKPRVALPTFTSDGVQIKDRTQGASRGTTPGPASWVDLNVERFRNPGGVAEVLKQQHQAGAKVITLQEVTGLAALENVLRMAGLSDKFSIQLAPGDQGIAILTVPEIAINRERIQMRKSDQHNGAVFLRTELSLGKAPDGSEEKFTLFVVHTAAKSAPDSYETRQKQFAELVKEVGEEAQRNGGRVLVVGDMNVAGRDQEGKTRAVSHQKELADLEKAFSSVGVSRIGDDTKPGRATITGKANKAFDLAFAGEGLRPEGGVKIVSGLGPTLRPGTPIFQQAPSDHAAIGGTLLIRPEVQSSIRYEQKIDAQPKMSASGSRSVASGDPAPTLPKPGETKGPLPKTQEERFEVTARAVRENLPGASAELIQKIQKLVEEKGHNNRSGVVKHYEATDQQLRARTQDLRDGLKALKVDPETAKKITASVIRGGAAGEADPNEGARSAILSRAEKQKRLDLLRSIIQTGENPLYSKELYQYLSDHPEYTERLLRSWYRYAHDLLPAMKKLGEAYVPLLLHPGVVNNHKKFFDFAKSFLATNPNASPQELRDAFKSSLGTRQLYRTLMLTPEEFGQINSSKKILARGSLVPGQLESALLEAFDPDVRVSNARPVQDTAKRVRGENQKIHRTRAMSMSLSKYPEVADAAAVHGSLAPGQTRNGKRAYRFEIQIPEFDIIEGRGLFWEAPGTSEKKLRIGDRVFNTLQGDLGIEVFALYQIELIHGMYQLNIINPADVPKVEWIKD